MQGNAAPKAANLCDFIGKHPEMVVYQGQGQDEQTAASVRAKVQQQIQRKEVPEPVAVRSRPSRTALKSGAAKSSRRGGAGRPPVGAPPVSPAAKSGAASFPHVFLHQQQGRGRKANQNSDQDGSAELNTGADSQTEYGEEELQPVYGKNTTNLIVQVNALVEYYKIFSRRIDFAEVWKGGQGATQGETKGEKIAKSLGVWLDKIGVEDEYRDYLLTDTVAHVERAWLSTEGVAMRDKMKRRCC